MPLIDKGTNKGPAKHLFLWIEDVFKLSVYILCKNIESKLWYVHIHGQ